MTSLIRSYRATGTIAVRPSRRGRFPGKYTEVDVRLLAEVDNAHEWLSSPATKCILIREYEEYGKGEYARLAEIAVAQIYNLRASPKYRRVAVNFEPTRPSPVSIGERRRPEPLGLPGFLRIDTVHQGDWDGEKGVYHINAVDAVTQFEVVGCTPRINAENLKPVLEAMLPQFPFPILGAHFDNGSEYINYSMEEMMKAMMVEFTKSRACRSQDNELVEGKNGAIIRKLIGYGHIPAARSGKVHAFYAAHLNPYLNFHRPCGFATVSLDARGKRERTYQTGDYATPHQKLRMLPDVETKLKPGISIETLDRKAAEMSDTEFTPRAKDSVAGTAVKQERCGNDGVEETDENQRRVSPCSLSSLGIRPNTPDSHIPTATTGAIPCPEEDKTKERKSVASRPPLHDLFQDHLVLETLLRFRIIRGLENAAGRPLSSPPQPGPPFSAGRVNTKSLSSAKFAINRQASTPTLASITGIDSSSVRNEISP